MSFCIRLVIIMYFQIKVCYSKNFTRVNCDGIKSTNGGDMMGKCLRWVIC